MIETKFKQTEVGMIPEDWEVKKLGEIAYIKDGTHQTPKYVNVGIPFYSVETVVNNDFKNTKYISFKEHKQLTSKFRIEKGDVLVSTLNSVFPFCFSIPNIGNKTITASTAVINKTFPTTY